MTPTYTAALFAPLHGELGSLLRSLSADDWQKPTVAGAWRVRDVVAHLLDVDLRKLSAGDTPIAPLPYAELLPILNDLNATWVAAARRISPRLLVEMIELTGPQVAARMESLPPHDKARVSVAWAGESESENWFDVGREYTERWHHQMQIRDAVGAPPLLERRWLIPLLDISVRVLPHAYAGTAGTIVLKVGDDAWSLVDGTIQHGAAPNPAATVTTDADTAWRLFFNAPIDPARIAIAGDRDLARPLLAARSVMV